MTQQFKCPKWIIEPDEMLVRVTEATKEKYFLCHCDIFDCGWKKERIGKIRRRIADAVFKMPWRETIKIAIQINIKLEE